MTTREPGRLGALILIALFAVGACSGGATTAPDASDGAPSDAPSELRGEIRIDGSSTVYPITEAIAEEFQAAYPGVRVTVAFSGTSGGFKKFCEGETDANDASRPIKDEEVEACAQVPYTPVELAVATDGLTVMVNPGNDFVECLTVAELNKIWDTGSTVTTWQDVRPEWPAEDIALFGAGADSGTFDYFTEEINGETDRIRSDFTQSEDDNALVQGIAADRNALGWFGYAYYIENADKLKAVAIDDEEGSEGCVLPNEESINAGTYTPLSRPIFIYPAVETLDRPEVAAFFQFYLDNVNSLLGTEEGQIGYIPLHDELATEARSNLEAGIAAGN
ncbi:MAG: PstS family phosphate ABC transporter substrate-binding protein [Chloroflexota bacterium]